MLSFSQSVTEGNAMKCIVTLYCSIISQNVELHSATEYTVTLCHIMP